MNCCNNDYCDFVCRIIGKFITALYKAYVDLYFTYLEINPLVVTGGKVFMLDLAAKLDATADFICRGKWGEVDYPPPFGRDAYPEEAYIADLDAKSGASLKVGQDYYYSPKLAMFTSDNVVIVILWIFSI